MALPRGEALKDWRLAASQTWFTRGLDEFRLIGDKSNAALLCCNLASSKKLEAGRLPVPKVSSFTRDSLKLYFKVLLQSSNA